jgi:protein-S-isoprenylcysteine O-methyltransferase Ste14
MMANDLIFRVLLAVILVGFMLHRAYYTRKYRPEEKGASTPEAARLSERVAGILAVLGLIGTILYIINPDWMAWSSLPLPDWLRWSGVIIALLGFGLLQWSQNTLGASWSDSPRLMEGHQMVTSGPYQRIRHPIYTSFLLILSSTFLISASWFIGGCWILMMALDINLRITREEELMISRYGDQYREYMTRTGRYFPNF